MTTPAVPDVSWNELVIARVHEGRTTVWTGWKRALGAFADPALYSDPAAWTAHFTEHPNAGWGPNGYGLVVVDLDRRTVWSLNDYQTPGSFRLPSPVMQHADGTMVVDDGLRALLATPSAWPHATLAVVPGLSLKGWLLKHMGKQEEPSSPVLIPLSALLDEAQTPQARLDAVTLHNGMLRWKGRSMLVMQGRYAPEGWTLFTDRDLEISEAWLALLDWAHSAGLPAPDWQTILDALAREDGSDTAPTLYRDALGRRQEAWQTAPRPARPPKP